MKKILFLFFYSAFLASTVAQVSNGLISKYSFNNGNATDEVGLNHGIVQGAVLTPDRFGNLNKAYAFNGVDNLISFGDSLAFKMGQNNFSISIWAKFSNAQFAPLLNKRNDSPTYDQYAINAGQWSSPGNHVGFLYKPTPGGNGSGPDRVYSSSNIDSSWHHIVVVHSFSDSTSLYLDGQLIGSSYTSFTSQNFDIPNATLTAGFTNVVGTDYYYNGSLDDIRIYNKTLNLLEIDSLYNEASPTVGIIDIPSFLERTINVYPNPTYGNVFLSEMANLSVFDFSGQMIFKAKNVNHFDISNYPKGIYFVLVSDENGKFLNRVKLIKN